MIAWTGRTPRTLTLLLFVIACGVTHSASATTVVVNDGGDSAACPVGFFTLRCAIVYANANPFTNIRFSPGLPAVLLQSSLPTITGNGTWIDGHDVNGGCVCPRIDGAAWSGAPGDAITINANDVTISSIAMVRIPAGNSSRDIYISGGKDTAIAGNYLGILPGATTCPATNANIGVQVLATGGASGSYNGVAYIYGNVISCHGGQGVLNWRTSFVYVGQDRTGGSNGNLIGVAPDGIHAAGNGFWGVYTLSGGDDSWIDQNVIAFNGGGGVYEQADRAFMYGNVISSNAGPGLEIDGGTDDHVVSNRIGTTADGTVSAPNTGMGVLIAGGANHYLGANTIAHNGGGGIIVEGSPTNAMLSGNDSYSNEGLPIDLGNNGATPNGSAFPPGPNDWLAYPVITSAIGNQLTGSTCASCRVEIFRAVGDPSMPGGGGILLAFVNATAVGQWAATLPDGLTQDDISLTATDSSGSFATSEMSPRPGLFDDGFELGSAMLWTTTGP